MHILNMQDQATMTSLQISEINNEHDKPMVFSDISIGVVYLMHQYVTCLNYEIAIPTHKDSVFCVQCGFWTVNLLKDGRVIECDGDDQLTITHQDVLDFYTQSRVEIHAANKKESTAKYKELIRDFSKVARVVKTARQKSIKTYFILNTSTGLIKIGKSKNPDKRLKEMQGIVGAELELMAVINENIEHDLHTKFSAYRCTGEWFDDKDDAIAEFIKSIFSNEEA